MGNQRKHSTGRPRWDKHFRNVPLGNTLRLTGAGLY